MPPTWTSTTCPACSGSAAWAHRSRPQSSGPRKIGTIDEVYLDDATGEPEWAAIRTGLFSRDAFVPLEPSELIDGALRVPFDRSLIKDAPDFGVGRHLSPEQELQLLDAFRPLDVHRARGA